MISRRPDFQDRDVLAVHQQHLHARTATVRRRPSLPTPWRGPSAPRRPDVRELNGESTGNDHFSQFLPLNAGPVRINRGNPEQIPQPLRRLHLDRLAICASGSHMYWPAAKISSRGPSRGSASSIDFKRLSVERPADGGAPAAAPGYSFSGEQIVARAFRVPAPRDTAASRSSRPDRHSRARSNASPRDRIRRRNTSSSNKKVRDVGCRPDCRATPPPTPARPHLACRLDRVLLAVTNEDPEIRMPVNAVSGAHRPGNQLSRPLRSSSHPNRHGPRRPAACRPDPAAGSRSASYRSARIRIPSAYRRRRTEPLHCTDSTNTVPNVYFRYSTWSLARFPQGHRERLS